MCVCVCVSVCVCECVCVCVCVCRVCYIHIRYIVQANEQILYPDPQRRVLLSTSPQIAGTTNVSCITVSVTVAKGLERALCLCSQLCELSRPVCTL